MQLPEIGHGLLGAVQFGLGNDLQERRAGPVQVNGRAVAVGVVHRLPGVFLKVSPGNADGLGRAVRHHHTQLAPTDDGGVQLADLVALGKVGIEIVLSRENRFRSKRGVDGGAKAQGEANRFRIGHRERPRQPELHGAGRFVGGGPGGIGGRGKELAGRLQLGVDFQANHDIPVH